MISFILSLILKLIFFIIGFVLNFIFSLFPGFDFSEILNVIDVFSAILGKGLNLLYFVSGPAVFVFGDIIIVLFTFKHIILPIANFTRKVIIK